MEGTSTPNNKDQMHNLPPEKAFVYWIPSIGVAIGMVLALLYSFWKFHKRKMITRQIQIEYMEVNFAAKRPRIGAIRCNTHGAKLDDLMASFNTPRFPHRPPYVKQSSKSRRPRRYDTLFEENEQTQDTMKQYTKYSIQYSTDKTNGENGKELNPYYEQSCKVESSPRPRKKTSSKRKKKKRSLLSIYGSSQARNNVELTTSSSPRRLPVKNLENRSTVIQSKEEVKVDIDLKKNEFSGS